MWIFKCSFISFSLSSLASENSHATGYCRFAVAVCILTLCVFNSLFVLATNSHSEHLAYYKLDEFKKKQINDKQVKDKKLIELERNWNRKKNMILNPIYLHSYPLSHYQNCLVIFLGNQFSLLNNWLWYSSQLTNFAFWLWNFLIWR